MADGLMRYAGISKEPEAMGDKKSNVAREQTRVRLPIGSLKNKSVQKLQRERTVVLPLSRAEVRNGWPGDA